VHLKRRRRLALSLPQVWTVKVAVHVLDHDGAVLDAAAAAALAALLSFRLPAVTVGGDTGTEVTVLPASVKEPVKLNVHMLPLALSFAFISPPNCAGEELLLLDPCAKEAGASCAVLTISATPDAELCAVHKAGGAALPPSQVSQAAGASA
jgi:exosome complex component RRP45